MWELTKWEDTVFGAKRCMLQFVNCSLKIVRTVSRDLHDRMYIMERFLAFLNVVHWV